MGDMYGAVRSNWFRVKDKEAFQKWFRDQVSFGSEIELWTDDAAGAMAFGGYEQYPNAWPNKIIPAQRDENHPEYDADKVDPEQWDLEAFAVEVRKLLAPGEELRVLAAGHEKLRYVAATHLVVTHEKVECNDYYEGN